MAANRKQACFEDLKNRILAMDIAPGSDLDETALSNGYGMSRTPFREVLQRLAGSGYVALSENRGAKVASLDLAVLQTFFRTAPLIYASMARLAAENRSPTQLEALKETQHRFAAAVAAGDAGAMALCNHNFHERIGAMAQNAYLAASLDRLLIDHTRLGQMFYRPAGESERQAIGTASGQHDAMIAAIEDRDAETAVALTLQHWDLSRDRLESFVRPDPLPLDITEPGEKRDAL